MKYSECNSTLLSMKVDYYLAHFIPANFDLKSNTALSLNASANILDTLNENYPEYLEFFNKSNLIADCLQTGNIFNLVVEENNTDMTTTTYSKVAVALEKLKSICMLKNIRKIAISFDGITFSNHDLKYNLSINNKERIIFYHSKLADLISYAFSDTPIYVILCTKI